MGGVGGRRERKIGKRKQGEWGGKRMTERHHCDKKIPPPVNPDGILLLLFWTSWLGEIS